MNATPDPDADDRDFERVTRLVRAAGTRPVDAATARATRTRFLEQIAPPPSAGRARRFVFAALAVGAMGAAAAVVVTSWRTNLRPDPNAIAIANTAAPALARGPQVTPSPALTAGTLVRFRDGSEIEVGPDGQARLAETTDDGGRVVLEDGGLRVHVTPRPPGQPGIPRWTFQAGPFRVEVKGTAFRIAWHRDRGLFDLQMTEGEVLATGPGLARRVVAGQRLRASGDGKLMELDTPGAPRVAQAPRARRPKPAPAVVAPAESAASIASEPVAVAETDAVDPAPSWSHLVGRGQLDQVLALAEAEGVARALERRDADDLAALGTAARLVRRHDLARRVFRAQRLRFADVELGREAAFHLGRLADDVDRDPASAVAWYDQYLTDAPEGALAAEALGRKLGALDRQPGPRAATRDAARAYLDRFPDGPHCDLARRLLAQAE